jgi:hypothetical protein
MGRFPIPRLERVNCLCPVPQAAKTLRMRQPGRTSVNVWYAEGADAIAICSYGVLHHRAESVLGKREDPLRDRFGMRKLLFEDSLPLVCSYPKLLLWHRCVDKKGSFDNRRFSILNLCLSSRGSHKLKVCRMQDGKARN